MNGLHNRYRAAMYTGTLLLCLGFVLADRPALAINASPNVVHAVQPDGSPISLRIRGDEKFNWHEDANGYTVVRDQGRFVYARRGANGRLAATAHVVGKANPRALGLEKRVLPSQAIINQLRANALGSSSNDTQGAPAQVPPAGNVKNLVIAIRFRNHWDSANYSSAPRTVPTETDINTLFNAVGGDTTLAPTGSVRDVYSINSYGQMTLVSTIANWVNVSGTEQFYANGDSGDQTLHQALIEALEAVDQVVNFNDYDTDNDGYIDAITFLHSGYGAEGGGSDSDGTFYTSRIWSHRWVLWDTNGDGNYTAQDTEWQSAEGVKVWDYHISPALWDTSGTKIGRIGVISHETGHFFGLPDLYDSDGGGDGIGSYGMMANSWGFDGTQLHPPHFSPWSKVQLGWSTPTTISADGNYVLQDSANNNSYYRIDQGYPTGEYLLIENRHKSQFDAVMPQGGLAIWHIDENADDVTEGYPGQSGWPGNGNHYRVALVQADGDYDLERGNNRGDGGDVFRSAAVNGISTNGTSGSPSASFPNTDSYQGGNITVNYNTLSNISSPGASMSFDYSSDVAPVGPDLAQADYSNAYGQASGTYSATHTQNDAYQQLTESHSGGRPSNRYDRLQHTWSFNLNGGNHIFNVDAYRQDAGDNDNGFEFSLSTSTSGPWNTMFTVTATSDNDTYQTYDLGVSSGTVYIRVEDDNRVSKQNSNDRLFVDHMYIDGGAPLTDPPGEASSPSPADAAGNVSVNSSLSWSPGANADSHDVYFGANPTPASQGNQAASTFAPGALAAGTIYYWRIDEVNGNGTTVGPLWQFTTEEAILPGQASSPNPVDGAPGVVLSPTLSWTAGSDAASHDVYLGTSPGSTVLQGNQTGTSFSAGPLAADTTYYWRIDEVNAFGTTSGNEWSFSTGSAPLVELSADGYKIKGRHHVDLSWSGAATANVEVYRGGDLIATTPNNGAYTDNIGAKGGATYVYQVCETDGGACSSTVTGVF